MTTRLFFLLFLPLYLTASTPVKIDFYTGRLSNAKELAAEEGKLYFVQFTASWCEPCRWMDEVTYKDPAVVSYINENYIPVKVDIDDFDGFAYKQMYNIRMLPSVLVFSSNGELLEKYEESLAPLKMLKILKTHNTPDNRSQPILHDQNGSNRKPEANANHSPITRPPLTPSKVNPVEPIDEVDEDVYLSDMKEEIVEVEVVNKIENLNTPNEPNYNSGEFSVQVGVYSAYRNVEEKAAKVQKKFDEEIIVREKKSNSKIAYIVMVGKFPNREKANDFRTQIEAAGFSGMVKDLSMMK